MITISEKEKRDIDQEETKGLKASLSHREPFKTPANDIPDSKVLKILKKETNTDDLNDALSKVDELFTVEGGIDFPYGHLIRRATPRHGKREGLDVIVNPLMAIHNIRKETAGKFRTRFFLNVGEINLHPNTFKVLYRTPNAVLEQNIRDKLEQGDFLLLKGY